MSNVFKINLKIIKERVENKRNTEAAKEQFGVCINSGTREAMLCLRMLTDKYIKFRRQIYAYFIDYKKAFGRVKHEKIIIFL